MADGDGPDAFDVDAATDQLTDKERDRLDTEAVEQDDAGAFDATPLFLSWVEEHLAVVEYTHSDKSTAAWCPEWWKHPEVVARLWAVWQARLQADEDASVRLSAVSDWWLMHWDRHAATLFDTNTGPFRRCDRTLGHLYEGDHPHEQRVPYYAPPADWHR